MQTVALSCGKCGAPLAVPDATRFLTCTFCGARLEVRREGGAAFTAVLDQIAETTDRIAGDVEVLKLENELERLDRELSQGVTGLTPEESRELQRTPRAVLTVVPLVVVAFGVLWIGMAASMGAPVFFQLFGVVFIAFALWNVGRIRRLAAAAERAREDHGRRRAELLARLEALRRP